MPMETMILQHGNRSMPNRLEVRVILKRMHECVVGTDRQIRIHLYLMHFW
jgi:hypothetical protein